MTFRGEKLTRPKVHFGDGKFHRYDDRRCTSDLRRDVRICGPENTVQRVAEPTETVAPAGVSPPALRSARLSASTLYAWRAY